MARIMKDQLEPRWFDIRGNDGLPFVGRLVMVPQRTRRPTSYGQLLGTVRFPAARFPLLSAICCGEIKRHFVPERSGLDSATLE